MGMSGQEPQIFLLMLTSSRMLCGVFQDIPWDGNVVSRKAVIDGLVGDGDNGGDSGSFSAKCVVGF